MAKIFPGRWTARSEESFVVFLIGVRINRLWKVHEWAPVLAAMRPMVRELEAQPELGFLSTIWSIHKDGFMLTQYWRSFDQLIDYAQQKNGLHLQAWRRFYQRSSKSGAVGIWHETYRVEAGGSECIYANMPRLGLAAWGRHVPAQGALHDARGRMGTPQHR